MAVLINRAHRFTDLICTVDAFEDALLGAIDGTRTLAEILALLRMKAAASERREGFSSGYGTTTRSCSTRRVWERNIALITACRESPPVIAGCAYYAGRRNRRARQSHLLNRPI